MRKTTLAAAMACAMVAAPAAAEAWRVAAQNDGAVMLVDTDSLERRGNMVLVTVMTVAPPQRAGEWDRSVIRREIDCAGSRSSMLERRFFRGSIQISHATNREPADNHTTESMMGGVLRAACGTRDYQSGVVGDPIATAWGMLSARSSGSGQIK